MGTQGALTGRLQQLLVQAPSLQVGPCGDGVGVHLHISQPSLTVEYCIINTCCSTFECKQKHFRMPFCVG